MRPQHPSGDLAIHGATPDTVSQGPRSEQIRHRLLTAMVEVAAHRGYREASVAQVIESAETSRSSFYGQFTDIGECFLAALERCADRLIAEIEQAVGGVAPKDAGGAALEVLVGLAERDLPTAGLLFIESLAGGPSCLDVRDQLCDRTAAIIEEAWAKLPSDGPMLDLPIEALVGGVFRLLSMRLRHRESGLQQLPAELPIWANSYAIPEGPPRWREQGALGAAEPPPSGSSSSIPSPQPLAPGRHRLSANEVARDQRQRILAATVEESFECGYAAITVAQITATARVSRNVFYSQFSDKQHAAGEAHELIFQRAMSTAAAAFFAAPTWPERVWEGGRALTEFIAASPQESYFGFVEAHAIGAPAILDTYNHLMAFTLFVEEGYNFLPEGQGLPRLSSEAIAALMFEIAYRALRRHRSAERLPGQLPQLVYMCLAPFIGPLAATEFVDGKVGELAAAGDAAGAGRHP